MADTETMLERERLAWIIHNTANEMNGGSIHFPQALAAADAILADTAALRAERDALREALRAAAEALEPFADVGVWLFAGDAPDDTSMVEFGRLNAPNDHLTRGHFKATHTALECARALLDGAR